MSGDWLKKKQLDTFTLFIEFEMAFRPNPTLHQGGIGTFVAC